MKYFLDCDTMLLYAVPKEYQFLLDIINSNMVSDYTINDAKRLVITFCKVKLKVSALTPTL